MSETLEEKVKSLSSNIENLTKSVDQLNSPDMSGIHHDEQGRLASYWENDEKQTAQVSLNKAHSKSLRTFPVGYKPFSEFHSFGEFIRCGFKDRSEVIAKTKKSWGMCKAIQGMSEIVGADGGISVLPEFHQEILTRIYLNDIFSRTDHYQVAGNNMTFPTDAETSRTNGSRGGGLRAYWVGEGDPLTGSLPKLAGKEIPTLIRRRIIRISDPPTNLLGGAPSIPPIDNFYLQNFDYRVIPGQNVVSITPASRPQSHGSFYGYGWGYGWGYGNPYYSGYYNGPFGYYGGYFGGPFGYFGGGFDWPGYGGYGYDPGYYGPYGANSSYYVGPYDFDADGNAYPGGGFNSQGYNEFGFNKDGFDPAGFDVNGLNADGDTWAYYGVWGHLHSGQEALTSAHRNDHGINRAETTNFTAAGAFGIATWVKGSGFVVAEIEQRDLYIDRTETGTAPVSALVAY